MNNRLLPFLYYYINKDGDKIPIITGDYTDDFASVVFLDETGKEKMRHDFPDAVGHLYAFIAGESFKLNL